MHHTSDSVLRDDSIDRFGVSDIADNKGCIAHGLTEAGCQVIKHDHALASSAQLLYYVAADIPGTACD
jgi:hypothetical protein